jgi:hypothetical protein
VTPATPPQQPIHNNRMCSRLRPSSTPARRQAAEAPSEVPSEDRDGEEAGTHHHRTAVAVITLPTEAAASPAGSRSAAVRTGAGVSGPVALPEAISVAGPGLGGRLLRKPNASNGCRRLFFQFSLQKLPSNYV